MPFWALVRPVVVDTRGESGWSVRKRVAGRRGVARPATAVVCGFDHCVDFGFWSRGIFLPEPRCRTTPSWMS